MFLKEYMMIVHPGKIHCRLLANKNRKERKREKIAKEKKKPLSTEIWRAK